jgi:uncharacterized membrane protein
LAARPNGFHRVAAGLLFGAMLGAVPRAACAGDAASDAEVLAIVHKHCTMCHARKPTHEAFQQAPNGVVLETIAELRNHAALIYAQTVQNKAMPLGNQTAMTEAERATLGRWLQAPP